MTEETKKKKHKKSKSISQLEMAKEIAESTGLSLEVITHVIEEEQKLTMLKIKKGYKVCKKNYITLTPVSTKERKIYSPLTQQVYEVPAKNSVRITLGEGFLSVLNKQKPMKDLMCRFVGLQ